MRIIGATVGTTIPKPSFDQTDPKKGDYIKGDRSFLNAIKTINGVAPDDSGDIVLVLDTTLTQAGVAADAKAVGDLWRAYPDDNDLAWLLAAIGLAQYLADETGAVLTDETGAILLL